MTTKHLELKRRRKYYGSEEHIFVQTTAFPDARERRDIIEEERDEKIRQQLTLQFDFSTINPSTGCLHFGTNIYVCVLCEDVRESLIF